jgi:hypothetical protein
LSQTEINRLSLRIVRFSSEYGEASWLWPFP